MNTPNIEPARNALAVTKSDSNKLEHVTTKGLTVNAAGNLALRFADMADDATPVVVAVLAGIHYPWVVKQIMSTNTTATGFTAYW